jgi:hypothetical protein
VEAKQKNEQWAEGKMLRYEHKEEGTDDQNS